MNRLLSVALASVGAIAGAAMAQVALPGQLTADTTYAAPAHREANACPCGAKAGAE